MPGRGSKPYLQRNTLAGDQDAVAAPWRDSTSSSLSTPPALQAPASLHQPAAPGQQADATPETSVEPTLPSFDYSFGQIPLLSTPAFAQGGAPANPPDAGSGDLAQEPPAHTQAGAAPGRAAFPVSAPLPYSLGGPPSDTPAARPTIQFRLSVSRVDDPLEAEAERTADRITQQPEAGTALASGAWTAALPYTIQPARTDNQAGLSLDDPSIEAEIQGLSGGQPLPAAEQDFFEARMGYRLDDVHLHTGSQAERLAGELHAEAFTTGSNIVFGPGRYAPGTSEGRYLLAHELTHVVQQTGGNGPADAGDSGVTQAKHIQRAPAADEGVCPVCGKIGKGTCPDCGSPFIPIQCLPAADDGASDPDAPIVQRSILDDVVSFGTGAVDSIGEGVSNLAEMGAEGFATLIRQIAPGMADLIQKGPIATLTGLIGQGVRDWLQSLLGSVDLGGMVQQLTGSFSGVFTVIKDVLNGDPASCGTVADALNSLRGLVQSFAENPLIQQVKELFGSVQAGFDQVNRLIMAPVIDTLFDVGGTAFQGIKTFAGTIAGWASQIRSVLGPAWDWACQQLGLPSGGDQGGIFEWLKEQAGQVWEQLRQTVEPVIGPLKTVGTAMLAFSPVGPIYLLINYGPQIVKMADWVVKHSGDPEIVKKSQQEMGDTILPQILETVQGAGQAIAQVSSELASSALQLGQSVVGLLESISGVQLLSPAQQLVQKVSEGVQELTRWAQEKLGELSADAAQLFEKAKQIIEPYKEVLCSIGTAIACPPMIPMIIGGWAWRRLPDCYKLPIIDFLLDICITYLENAIELPGMGKIWPLVKSGVLGFLYGLRGQDPALKIAVSNRIARIISGASPEFLLGFASGFVKGMWEGLTDPFVLIYNLLTLLGSVVQWLGEQTSEAVSSALAPDEDGPGKKEQTLQERAQAMADELQPPVEEVTTNFMPAVEEFFSGEGMTMDQLQQKLGEVWDSMTAAMRDAGGELADSVCQFFTSDGADRQIGETSGWLLGTITFEVVLAALTYGASTGLTALKPIIKVLNWTDGALELAFKGLIKAGGLIQDALKALGGLFSKAKGAVGDVLGALREIGEKLVKFGDELLGRGAKEAAGKADNVADASKVLPGEQVDGTGPRAKRADDVDGNAAANKADGDAPAAPAAKDDSPSGAAEKPDGVTPPLRDPAEVWDEIIRTYPNTRVMGDVPGGLDKRREAFIAKCQEGWWYDVTHSKWHRVDTTPRVAHIFSEADDPKYILGYLMDRVEKGSGKRSLPGYIDALKRSRVVKNEDEVLNVLKEMLEGKKLKDLDEDTIRHALKEYYSENLLEATIKPSKKRLRELYGNEGTFEDLRHRYMIDITKSMNSADKGNFVEDWLYEIEGLGDGAPRHVRISKEQMKEQGVELKSDRIPDVIREETIVERKAISGPFSDHDIQQMEDYLAIVGNDIPLSDGTTRTINRIEYTLPIPEGVEANLPAIKSFLRSEGGVFSFVISNSKGQTKKIDSVSQLDGIEEWLGLK